MPLIGLLLFSTLDRDFFPANDRNMFQVRVELPNNSSVNATIDKVKDVREQLSKYDFIENDFWFVGRKLPRILGLCLYRFGWITFMGIRVFTKLANKINFRIKNGVVCSTSIFRIRTES